MPAAVTSHARRNPPPPAKKTKLSSSQSRSNGLSALLSGAPGKKPTPTAKLNGVRNARNDNVQDAAAIVSGGRAGHGDVDMQDATKEIIDISSAEEESDYDSSDDDQDKANTTAGAAQAPLSANGLAMDDDQPMDDGAAESDELTFGERIQAQEAEPVRAPHVVDVEEAFGSPNDDSRALATASGRPLTTTSASSLGTVLTQALRTNDQELLDSCLHVLDVETIYATVERLPSPLVGSLLQKLAERLQQKPGRAGILMVWVQWSLAAHGGYLASQPQLVKQLDALNRVLRERASGLQPLLALKGRLDMLQAQLELRNRNQKRLAGDDAEEAVIMVEGEDDSSTDENDASDIEDNTELAGARKRLRLGSEEDDEDISSIDEMPTTMEVDEDEEGSEDSDDLIDDEAEETDSDTGEEDPLSDDFGGDDVASESEEESKPARRSTIGRAGPARRY
ncbi:Dip2/Utp12 family-domain-containing protein [Dendryphion nanum]|uniref:Dip2/Utp12 family-domain-containing protein n=1 Tax=Dendryphion nanum TaxID=256645 RepID=A0A9P9DDV1_9PLEO|nr:Dip2/Utp12 family-domain-containing protein [Dendryphion nanum]